MNYPNIAFIGGGNMAQSLIAGMIAQGYPAHQIWVTHPKPQRLIALTEFFPGIQTTTDNVAAANQVTVVVFSVKPQVMPTVALELRATIQQRHLLVVSIAAGISTTALTRWLHPEVAIIRCMPNTPAMVNAGVTAIYVTERVPDEHYHWVEQIMQAVGMVVRVTEEKQIDMVTAISGSGPAYFFFLMEVLEQAALQLGLDATIAQQISVQTALGAAKLATEKKNSPTILRQQVTSPNGTTAKALAVLQTHQVAQHFTLAIQAAFERAQELCQHYESGSL